MPTRDGLVLLDVAAGARRPAPAGGVYWCDHPGEYEFRVAVRATAGTKPTYTRAAFGTTEVCDAKGAAAQGVPSRAATRAGGADLGTDREMFTLDDGYAVYRV